MAETANHPQTAAERLISGTIEWTWALWLVGGLYIAGPALGWALAGMVALALYLDRVKASTIPGTVWAWLAGDFWNRRYREPSVLRVGGVIARANASVKGAGRRCAGASRAAG